MRNSSTQILGCSRFVLYASCLAGCPFGRSVFVWSWARSRVIRFGRSSLAHNTRALYGIRLRLLVLGPLLVIWFCFRSNLSLRLALFGRLAACVSATRSRTRSRSTSTIFFFGQFGIKYADIVCVLGSLLFGFVFAQIFHFVWLCLVVLQPASAPHARARARVAPPQFFFSGKLVSKFELLINTLITYKPTTLWVSSLVPRDLLKGARSFLARACSARRARGVRLSVRGLCCVLF